MVDISHFTITEEKWQSMSEAERLKAIRLGDLTPDQLRKVHDEGTEEQKEAVEQYRSEVGMLNRLSSPESILESLRLKTPTLGDLYESGSGPDSFQIFEPQDLDELSGLYRPVAFDRDLKERTAASEQSGQPLALIMFDIDKFKSVNDNFGHAAGNEAIQSVAKITKQSVGEKGRSYRFGGDEFTVLLPNYTADEAAALAERIRRQIETSSIGSRELRVTVSVGIAEVPTHAKDPAELFKLADAAMYEAKHLGRNLVRVSGEPKPTAPGPRLVARKQPDPSSVTETQAEIIREHYFRYHVAYCPVDSSVLRIDEINYDERKTPDLMINCPRCGLLEKLAGPS